MGHIVQAAGEIHPDAQVVEVILSAHSTAWMGEQTKDRSACERLPGILSGRREDVSV